MARPGLRLHRKFRRLVALLRLPEPYVRGYLEMLWESCYETGDPHLGDQVDVEAAAMWQGSPGELLRALLDAGGDGRPGFIEEETDHPGTYRIHDLYDHAPEYVKKRRDRELARRTRGRALAASDAVRSASGHRPDTGRTLTITQAPAPAPLGKDKSDPGVAGVGSIPDSLDVPAFRAAWDEWHAYRREAKLRPWKPRTIAAKLRELAEMGPPRAIAAIRHSIANGYGGIFEPSGAATRPGAPPTRFASADRTPDPVPEFDPVDSEFWRRLAKSLPGNFVDRVEVYRDTSDGLVLAAPTPADVHELEEQYRTEIDGAMGAFDPHRQVLLIAATPRRKTA